jgi:hypothetical protein
VNESIVSFFPLTMAEKGKVWGDTLRSWVFLCYALACLDNHFVPVRNSCQPALASRLSYIASQQKRRTVFYLYVWYYIEWLTLSTITVFI